MRFSALYSRAESSDSGFIKYLHIKIDMQSNIELCDCEEFLALPPAERSLFLKIFEKEKKNMQKRMKEIGRM